MAKLHFSIIIAFLMSIPMGPLVAQELEEIVVTATRRAESLQDVPIAITAVTDEELQAFNINSTGRLDLVTPGLVWGNEGAARAWPTLRGIQTGNGEANGEPSLAFFIDGVYKSRASQASAPLLDVERVEVLRGPQGTLFGRNSTSGAINVVTKRPDFEAMSYFADLTVGDYSNVKLDAGFNLPLNDQWALRIAARRHKRDGYIDNQGPGPDPMDEDLIYGRLSLLFDNGTNFSANLRVGYREIDRVGGGAFTAKVVGQSYDTSIPGRSIYGDAVYVNPRISDGVPDITVGGEPRDVGIATDPDPFKIDINWPISETGDSLDMSLELNYEFESVTFRSLTGYADFVSTPFGDNDYTSLSHIRNRVDALTGEAETLQQEFQLLSNSDGPLDWVIGAFFLQDEVFEIFSIQQFDINDRVDPAFPSPGGGNTSYVFDRRTTTDIDSRAIYGQATYSLSEQLNITVGGRWSEDEKDYTLREFGFLGILGFNPDLDLNQTFDDFTWRVGFEYFTSNNSMWYGSVSTGFRSGGFNRFQDDPATPNNEAIFDSEEITAYEIGSKNTFLSGAVRLNAAAFFQELEDQQVGTVRSVAGTGQSGFFNAGVTEVSGLEFELHWQASSQLFVFATATLLDAEYKEFDSSGFAGDGGTQDLAGNEPPRAPNFRGTFSVAYDVPLGNGGTLTPSVTGYYSSEYHSTFYNTEIDHQDSYSKWDARLVYMEPGQAWSVEGFVQNATDEGVQSYGVFGGSNAYFVNYLPPRTYGVRFRIQN